jgi:hypothetical protein
MRPWVWSTNTEKKKKRAIPIFKINLVKYLAPCWKALDIPIWNSLPWNWSLQKANEGYNVSLVSRFILVLDFLTSYPFSPSLPEPCRLQTPGLVICRLFNQLAKCLVPIIHPYYRIFLFGFFSLIEPWLIYWIRERTLVLRGDNGQAKKDLGT